MRWGIATLLLFGVLGCDDSNERRNALLAGCKSNDDCPKGLVCEKTQCRQPSAEKPKAKPAPAAKPAPKAEVGDLSVRLCPGYWGKSHNTGTVIAKNIKTGKKKYLSMPRVVADGEFEDTFSFPSLPYGDYEVSLFTGVIAQGKQDLMKVPCAQKMACMPDGRARVIKLGPKPSEEEWQTMLKKWQKLKYPGTDKDELRRACDFDVDRGSGAK